MCKFSLILLVLFCFSILSFGKNENSSNSALTNFGLENGNDFVPHVLKRDSDLYNSTSIPNLDPKSISVKYSQGLQTTEKTDYQRLTDIVTESTSGTAEPIHHQINRGLEVETSLNHPTDETSTEAFFPATQESSINSSNQSLEIDRTISTSPFQLATNVTESVHQSLPLASDTNLISNYSWQVLEQSLSSNNWRSETAKFTPTSVSNESQIENSTQFVKQPTSGYSISSTIALDVVRSSTAGYDSKNNNVSHESQLSSSNGIEPFVNKQTGSSEDSITLDRFDSDFVSNVTLPGALLDQSSSLLNSVKEDVRFGVMNNGDQYHLIPQHLIEEERQRDDLSSMGINSSGAEQMLGDDAKSLAPKINSSEKSQLAIAATAPSYTELKIKPKIVPAQKPKSKTNVQSLTTSADNAVEADIKKLTQKDKSTSTQSSELYKVYREPNKTTKIILPPTREPKAATKSKAVPKKYLPSIPVPPKSKESNSTGKCDAVSPFYKLVSKSVAYEVRIYPTSTWLSANVITNNRILAELEASNKLQKYFDGENEKGVHWNRTCPVLTQAKFKNSVDAREKISEYAVSFYLPTDGNIEVPSPNDSEVLVDTVEERTVFVYPFKARVWEMTDLFLQLMAKKLSSALRNEGEPFLSKYFYIASYSNSRTAMVDADYELWMYATRFRPHDVTVIKQPIIEEALTDVTLRTKARVCRGYECPTFEVLALHGAGIQKRRYFGGRFATFAPEFCDFSKAGIWRAFMPLHLYKHGVNSHFEVIGATRPAGVVHVRETESHEVTKNVTCNHTFTVSLYLPKRLQAAPPTAGAAAPRIKITELNDVIVYVQAVGGFLLVPDRIQREVRLFRQRLDKQNLCYKPDEFYLVVYDYISRFHGRLNEIWVLTDRCSNSL